MPKSILWASLLAVGLVALYWGLMFFAERSMLFPAPPVAYAPERPADAQPLWLATPAGRTEAWFLPPTRTPAGPAGRSPLLLFAHGNGELIDFWPAEFAEPRRRGMAVLLVEYPGYGRSPGHTTEATITQAMLAAHESALARQDLDPRKIVAYGRSLGGGAVCQLAARRSVAALVLESTFASVPDLARAYGVPAFLVRDPFDNLAVVRAYKGPLLLLHGSHDDIIAPLHSRLLAAAAPQAELHLLPCGHNDCPRQWPLVDAFLERQGILARP